MNQIIEFATNHWLMMLLWLITGSLLLMSISKQVTPSVTTQQLINLFNRKNGLIIDIRAKTDFSKGHIAGAINFSLEDLNNPPKKLENSKNNPIIVVCNAGVQATGACTTLKKQGFEQVFKLQGGIQSWLADHLPLTQE